jgi:hypothetical protein
MKCVHYAIDMIFVKNYFLSQKHKKYMLIAKR